MGRVGGRCNRFPTNTFFGEDPKMVANGSPCGFPVPPKQEQKGGCPAPAHQSKGEMSAVHWVIVETMPGCSGVMCFSMILIELSLYFYMF